jgi:hypothetical protein
MSIKKMCYKRKKPEKRRAWNEPKEVESFKNLGSKIVTNRRVKEEIRENKKCRKILQISEGYTYSWKWEMHKKGKYGYLKLTTSPY